MNPGSHSLRSIIMSAIALSAIGTFIVLLAGCASPLPATRPVNAGGAAALLTAAPGLRSAVLTDRDSRRVLHHLDSAQLDTLKTLLKDGFVSTSLLATTPPWDVALDLVDANGAPFTALYYGDVLRVNEGAPRSTIIADSAGAVPAPGIADLVLSGDAVAWLYNRVGAILGTPPSKSHRAPGGMPSRTNIE